MLTEVEVLMDTWTEYLDRNPDTRKYINERSDDERRDIETFMLKQNELLRVMNEVANGFIQWSMAKDHFISEVVSYSSELNAKINTGEMFVTDAIQAIDNEIVSLRKQSSELAGNNSRQVVIVKQKIDNNDRQRQGNIDLAVAGIGFVTGDLQVVAGAAMLGSGVGIIPGALLVAHGVNNVIESGYFLLYRESCTGPIRFIYEGIGDVLSISKSNSDVIYTLVDVGLSLNGLLGYRLAEDAARLYRYINADLLWGMRQLGMKMMSTPELLAEIFGDANTLFGQYRAY